jgi:hypothetical protein
LGSRALDLGALARAARRLYYQRGFDPTRLLEQQRDLFRQYGVDYDEAEQALNGKLQSQGLPSYDERSGMCSQHWIFFAGLAASLPSKARILEIGTFSAQFTQVLSILYPAAEIVTCDLPDNSPAFTTTYGRDSYPARKAMIEQRDRLLGSLPNVTFVQANSFRLSSIVRVGFDAIWVDGGHSYPDVAWDASNAFHMVKVGGYVLFDDVYLHQRAPKATRLIPDKNDSRSLLAILENEGLAKVDFMLKRLNARSAADPVLRKHFAVTRGSPLSEDPDSLPCGLRPC